MHNFHQQFNAFPSAGWGYCWGPHPDRGFGVSQPGFCFYALLPFLEQDALYRLGEGVGANNDTAPALLQANDQRLKTPLSVMYCPSRRRPSTIRPTQMTMLARSCSRSSTSGPR